MGAACGVLASVTEFAFLSLATGGYALLGAAVAGGLYLVKEHTWSFEKANNEVKDKIM